VNKLFLKKAVELSKISLGEGKFPAGALLARNNEIVWSETSSAYPNQHLHAETKIIDKAVAEINNQLKEYELYTSLAPCLMCFGKIYWSGISKVYYVLSREDVDIKLSYEGEHDFSEIINRLNRKIEFVQDRTYYDEALEIYKEWEEKMI
jgi:guanine deaminase